MSTYLEQRENDSYADDQLGKYDFAPAPEYGEYDPDQSINDSGKDQSATAVEPIDEGRKTRLLMISFALMLVFGLGNKITQVVQVSSIENYPVFLSLLTTFVYIPASFAYIIPMIRWGSAITPQQRAIPQWTFFKIGALDSIAGIITVLSITRIQNGTIIVLLSQVAIPISLICSKFFLGSKYKPYHYIGCVIVFIGLLVVLLPRFFIKKDDDDDDSNTNSPLVIGIAIIALVLSNIPLCFSTVVKELTLGDSDVDPVYLNGWVALWQFIVGIPLILPGALADGVAIKDIPANLINGAKCYVGINSITEDSTNQMAALSLIYMASHVGPIAAQKLSALIAAKTGKVVAAPLSVTKQSDDDILRDAGVVPQNISNNSSTSPSFFQQAFDSVVMTPFEADLIATHLGSSGHYLTAVKANKRMKNSKSTGDDDDKKKKKVLDKCERAPIYVNMYMAFNIVYNVLIIMMIKFGGANLFWVCMTIMVPLASIAFSLKFIPNRQPLRIWDILGLIILFSGLIVYRFYDHIRKWICGYSIDDLTEEGNEERLLSDQQGDDSSYPYTAPIDTAQPLVGGGGGINSDAAVMAQYDHDAGLTSSSYGRASSFPRGDSYLEAQLAPTITESTYDNTTNHGRKKVKKRRK